MDEHVMHTYRRSPEVFVSGRGAVLVDRAGTEYLDFLSGIAVSALGHGHPRLVAELQEQVAQIVHVSNLFRHPYTEQVAEKVTALCGLDSVFFANTGTESVEAALKIARKYHSGRGKPRPGIVALTGSFHGRTLGALSVTHTERYRTPFEPLLPGVRFVERNDLAAVRAAFEGPEDERPGALILEPIQGENGVYEMTAEFLRGCRQLCDETDTVLIHDEVQCGSGRTGTFLCADHAGVKPDIATLAKPIAAGLPMGMAVVGRKLKDVLAPGDHGSTFAGGPLVCRAALVFLEELTEGGLLATVRERGIELRAALTALTEESDLVAEARGRGLIQGLRLHEPAHVTELQAWLYAHGLITNVTGGDVLRLLPPYIVTSAQIGRAAALIREGLSKIRQH